MSGVAVELLFGVRVDREEFIDMVVALGGVRGPGPVNDATLARGERAVWMFVDPGEEPDPEQVLLAEERLGGPVATRVILDCSSVEGSDRLALEVIEAAARRWPLLVDTLNGDLPTSETLVTAEDLRARVDAGKRYVFDEEAPPGVSVADMLERDSDDGDG